MFKKMRTELLSGEEQAYVLDLARRSMEAAIRGAPLPKVESRFPNLELRRAAFVTLHKKGELRGCIGLLNESKPLGKAVQEAAVAAACQDPRFQPVSAEELNDITIEVSVLTPLKRISNPKRIKVGKHGLLIRSGEAQGLLLPQVAVNNRWNRLRFLEHTCIKAGLPRDAWQQPGVSLMTFGAQVFEEASSTGVV